MSFCPIDGKVCIDDLCRGSMRCFQIDVAMLNPCPRCKQLVSPEDNDACTCEPDDYEPDEADLGMWTCHRCDTRWPNDQDCENCRPAATSQVL